MLLRPKSLAALSQQQQMHALGAMAALLLLVLFLSAGTFSSSNTKDLYSVEVESKMVAPPLATKPVPIHQIDTQVKASLFANPQLKKPLELLSNTHEVSCPERGGKNTQCGKVYSEYRWLAPQKGDYYLYVQVKAPTLNDNSLWIDHVGADSKFYEDSACKSKQQLGDLVPHKHRSGSELLCCPKYLAKNAKKGLAAFYSDCCFTALGKEGNESGCVLDLEVESGPKWNQFPRVIKVKAKDEEVSVRIYAREDGTSWTGLVLSQNGELDADALNRLSKKSLVE